MLQKIKNISIIPVLLITVTILTNYLVSSETKNSLSGEAVGEYYFGILESEKDSYLDIANYKINVELNHESDLISADESIIWINKTQYETSEIQFHLYPNAFKNNKTEMAKGNYIPGESITEIKINEFEVDGNKSELIYFSPDIENQYDSTVAKILLKQPALPGDTVEIDLKFQMKVPLSFKRMGRAIGRDFYFFSQWYPKVGVFENGEWICSQYHPYTNFYSEFGNYEVNIKVPANFQVAATGSMTLNEIEGDFKNYSFVQNGVHDFVWTASDEFLIFEEKYIRYDGSEILLSLFIQPEKENYYDRYLTALKNSLKFFEENIGDYPYETLTLVDVPRTSRAGGMEYPTLFTVDAELFSPQSTNRPEMTVIHEFTHQYFYGLIANNEVYEAWLDEGFAMYTTSKIINEYYGDPSIVFHIAGYVPVYGLQLMAYNEIPIIYSLGNFTNSEGTTSLRVYYENKNIGTIADTSFKHPDFKSYYTHAYYKSELMLLSLERYLGYDTMMKILRQYFDEYKFKHPKGEDFIRIVEEKSDENMDWFFEDVLRSAKVFDYKVDNIKRLEENKYEVIVHKLGSGSFKSDIIFYTDKDTLYQKWDGEESWKSFIFETENEVIAAEIDPLRKNPFDINYSNNSYTIEGRYGAALSLATRVFFWFQNALMQLGSIG